MYILHLFSPSILVNVQCVNVRWYASRFSAITPRVDGRNPLTALRLPILIPIFFRHLPFLGSIASALLHLTPALGYDEMCDLS